MRSPPRNLTLSAISPSYEVNDLGFQTTTDRLGAQGVRDVLDLKPARSPEQPSGGRKRGAHRFRLCVSGSFGRFADQTSRHTTVSLSAQALVLNRHSCRCSHEAPVADPTACPARRWAGG